MSYTKEMEEEKDTVLFLTKEDQEALISEKNAVLQDTESAAEEEEEGVGGAIKPNGEIDWDCPCLKGMAYGPCGQEFRDAFSCFVKSEAEPKGMDCVDAFEQMQKCMASHPEHYGPRDDDDDEEVDGTKPTEENTPAEAESAAEPANAEAAPAD